LGENLVKFLGFPRIGTLEIRLDEGPEFGALVSRLFYILLHGWCAFLRLVEGRRKTAIPV
jgi:hypothetical protein